jgi:hypothetical protein
MTVYKVLDFSDIVDAVREELKVQSDDTVTINRIKRIINTVYLQEVIPYSRWKWLEGFSTLQLPAVYNGGTASITQDSATVTLSATPSAGLGSFLNYRFAVKGENEIYTITAHTAGSASLTISPAINCTTDTTATFEIYRDWLALPTDCDETVQVWHDHQAYQMEGRGLKDFRLASMGDPRRSGRPQLYYTGDYYDPSTGTNELETDRYRQMFIYPSISDKKTSIHVTYKKQVDALEDDADEPVLPVEDRIVLVFGALARAWRMQRNPDEALQNERLFKERLARMAGKTEDSQDMPVFKPDMAYIGTKRGSRIGHRSSVWSAPGSGGGGGASVITYLSDVTIDGANISDDVTVDSGITIDGRDISVDGATLDAAVVNIAALSTLADGKIYVGNSSNVATEVTVSGDISLSNAGVAAIAAGVIVNADVSATAAIAHTKLADITAGSVLMGNASNAPTATALSGDVTVNSSGVTAIGAGVIVDADVSASAALTRSKTASGTAYRILANNSSGVMSENAAITASRAVASDANGQLVAATTTAVELEFVNGVTSAIQTQLNTKAPSASPTFSGTITTPLTASRAVVTGASSELSIASTTATEIGYVNGVTSAIQTQLDAKQARSTLTAKGDLYVATASATVARQAVGTDGQVLTADSGQTNGVTWSTPAAAPTQSYELSNLGIAASVAANALTIALKQADGTDASAGSPVKIGFRNSTATTGQYAQRTVTSSLSITVSSGSTLGHANSVARYIFVYAIDNAGTVELAVSSALYDDGSVVTTTAEGGAGAADAINTIYSTTARTDVALRLICRVLNPGQATAGTYASAMTEVSLVPFHNFKQGVQTNSSPKAGEIGEYVESIQTVLQTTAATTQWKDITSITLTPGDWDIGASWWIEPSGATISSLNVGIGTASGNDATGMVNGHTGHSLRPSDSHDISFSQSPYRVSISVSTTYYLKFRGAYTVSDIDGKGGIWARRVR